MSIACALLFASGTASAESIVAPPSGSAPALVSNEKVELAIGYSVKDRELEAMDGDKPPFSKGDLLVAWTSVRGVKTGAVTHVWLRDGVEVSRKELTVTNPVRFRTWSRLMANKSGRYDVKVFSTEGTELASTSFMVE